MVTLPPALRVSKAPGTRANGRSANPVRRGPVVLATDGTGRSGAVVVAAQLLAERLGLSLEVVTVLPSVPYPLTPDVMVPIDPVTDDIRREARETTVCDYVTRYSGGATPARIHVRVGDTTTEIGRFANEVSATIVVIGSAPHRRLGRVRCGERAAHVLRAVSCPVLSVPPNFADLPRLVLAAVDFSPSSIRAAQAALLVVHSRGTVVLTHVLPPLVQPSALSVPHAGDREAAAREMFDRLLDELRPSMPPGVTTETQILTAEAAEGILSSADVIDADLVAVGTHASSILTRLLLGSVAEQVLYGANTMVLAAPPPSESDSAELWRHITGAVDATRSDHLRLV